MTSEHVPLQPASPEAIAAGEATTFEKLDAAGQYESGPPRIARVPDRMLKFFEYRHLPLELAERSQWFAELADKIEAGIPSGPERTVALRKLLEAKDAAVRAVVYAGG